MPAPGAPPLAGETVVLASASATRRTLLAHAGVACEAMPARIDEEVMRDALAAEGAAPAAVAETLAEHKARAVSRRVPDRLVIGADQVLVCDGALFAKPADRAAARAQLVALRGRDHELVSCVCAVRGGVRLWHHVAVARMRMRDFGDDFLDAYLEAVGEEALGGPGAYRLEGFGAQLFAAVSGDHFAILGLPLLPLLDYLRSQGTLQT